MYLKALGNKLYNLAVDRILVLLMMVKKIHRYEKTQKGKARIMWVIGNMNTV